MHVGTKCKCIEKENIAIGGWQTPANSHQTQFKMEIGKANKHIRSCQCIRLYDSFINNCLIHYVIY